MTDCKGWSYDHHAKHSPGNTASLRVCAGRFSRSSFEHRIVIGNFLKVAPDEVDIIFESVDTVPPSYRTAVNSAAWLLDVLTRGQSRRINIVDAAEKLSIRPLALCVIGTRIPVRTLHSARQVHGKKRIVSDKQRGATNLDLASPKALTEVLRRTMRGYGAASNDGRAQQ